MRKKKLIFDIEIIGKKRPVFLFGAKEAGTGITYSFWGNKKSQMQDLIDLAHDESYTWVSFNGIRFDNPLVQMAMYGYKPTEIKDMANRIIMQNLMPWDIFRGLRIEPIEYDHIDLMEVAPGVRISLKLYAGRMHYPTLVDLPFPHDKDLRPSERDMLEEYCLNDLGVTERLLADLEQQITLREQLSEEHGMDLRSKSDAQVAEAILKKAVGVRGRREQVPPPYVTYTAPEIIQTDNPVLRDLIDKLEDEHFYIKNGSPQMPKWLEKASIEIGKGRYKIGIGGLHSQHDKQVHYRDRLISDFDVGSYYPSIMLKCGITPQLNGADGARFLDAYRDIFDQRQKAKREGNKAVSEALKISLNGTFGKLGSPYSALYTPELMLAVTITGQLNLLMLIAELEKIKGVEVLSANTDGIMVGYTKSARAKVLRTIKANRTQTGFVYEEAPYREVAMKDVNNYIAVKPDGTTKAKGLYAKPGLMKNPAMYVCSLAASQYLVDGTRPEHFIRKHAHLPDFMAVRNVTGGAEWQSQELGRVVRWYMSTELDRAIRYASNGNKVPKTDGARPALTLPETFPDDLDYDWYIREAYSMLADMGVEL